MAGLQGSLFDVGLDFEECPSRITHLPQPTLSSLVFSVEE
jgi:hypothetical protein